MKTYAAKLVAASMLLSFGFSANFAEAAKFSYSPKEYKALKKRVKKYAKRKVAQVDHRTDASSTSKEFRAIRSEIIGDKKKNIEGIKTAADVPVLLAKLEKQIKAGVYKEPDALLLAHQLMMFKPFQGMIYRSRNIFEKNRFKKARAAHTAAVTALRATAAGVATYLDSASEWDAFYNYTVEPHYAKAAGNCDKTWTATCEISDGITFQKWLMNEVKPHLEALVVVLKDINLANRPIHWDNQILFGQANFTSSRDRFIRLGEAERLAMLSAAEAALSSIYGMDAYHLDGLFESVDSVAKVYGVNAFFKASKATAMDRFNAIRKNSKLFTLKENYSKENMATSYDLLKASLQSAHLAWKAVDGQGSQDTLFDPRAIAPFQRILNTGFNNAFGLMGINTQGSEIDPKGAMSAVVNGEKVVVYAKKFFDEPPKNLQAFMPTAGVEGAEWLKKKVDGKQISYRNYRRGNPSAWNYKVYGKYFRNVKSAEDVRRVNRVLSQSWGTFFLGIPLGMMVL